MFREALAGIRREFPASLLAVVLGLALSASCNGNARVTVNVRDAATGELVPAKIAVFLAADHSIFDLHQTSSGQNIYVWRNFLDLGMGTGTLILPAGTYTLYASAGVEWTVDKKADVPLSGTNGTIEFEVQRVVDTSNWISADFHVHAYPSFDGILTVSDRVVSYLVEGVEVIGSGDHDCVTDYGPVISSIGVSGRIASIRGVEGTPKIGVSKDGSGNCRNAKGGLFGSEPGHWNAFPINPSLEYNSQMDEGVSAATIYDGMRAMQSEPVVIQLNHPNYSLAPGTTGIDWFASRSRNFQKDQPIPADYGNPAAPNAFLRRPSSVAGSLTQGIDFDAIEIMPPDSSVDWRTTREQWFALLNQGFLKVGTANTDSHVPGRTPGYPRTYVKVADDTPIGVTPEEIRDRVLAGEVMGTTGPFLSLTLDGNGLGTLTTDVDGEVALGVTVSAAPWIEVGEARIVRNGQTVWSQSIAPRDPEPVVRYEGTIVLPVVEDSWFVLEAGSPLPANPQDPMYVPFYYQILTSSVVPIAFTNPVYVDFDGDGGFSAPGL